MCLVCREYPYSSPSPRRKRQSAKDEQMCGIPLHVMSGGCYIVIFLPKGRIYAIFGIFASKCRYYGKCDGRMCQIRELGVTFALNLQNTGVYGGGRGRRMGRMDASEKFHSLGKIFRRYIDHYYKLFLFLKKCIAEINQKEMLLWTGVSSYSKNTAFFP